MKLEQLIPTGAHTEEEKRELIRKGAEECPTYATFLDRIGIPFQTESIAVYLDDTPTTIRVYTPQPLLYTEHAFWIILDIKDGEIIPDFWISLQYTDGFVIVDNAELFQNIDTYLREQKYQRQDCVD